MVSNFQNVNLRDQKGVVRTVSGNACTVYLYDEMREVSIPINQVDPTELKKKDRVRTLNILFFSSEIRD